MSTLDGIIASAGGSGGGGAGDVTGPGSSTSGNLPSFSGTTGKVLQDSGVAAASVATGPASATDNALARFDSTTGKLLQNSDVTVSDLAAGAVTITAGKGTAITLKNTNPDATTGASVAGDAIAITAGDAVASTDTAGAAAGGSVTITAGAAARLTSGNAAGGNINLNTGAGIGTGARGHVILTDGSGVMWSDVGIKRLSGTNLTVTDQAGTTPGSLYLSALVAGGAGGNLCSIGRSGSGATVAMYNAGEIGFSDNGNYGGNLDTRFGRIAAGQLAIRAHLNGASTNVKVATTTVSLSGATTTATGLFPAKCIQLGVSYRVTTAATSGDGGTSINVGDGTDPDRYGATIAFTLNTTGDLSSATADPRGWSATAGDVVFTCNGGTFSGGVVRVCAHYMDLTAPTS